MLKLIFLTKQRPSDFEYLTLAILVTLSLKNFLVYPSPSSLNKKIMFRSLSKVTGNCRVVANIWQTESSEMLV